MRRLVFTLLLPAIVWALVAATSDASRYSRVRYAVCQAFGRYCAQAMRVVGCETGGTYSVWATNGQYVNIFQMGYAERRRYGWHVAGSPPRLAARAAFRYFVASGRDWSPWACKP